MLTRTVILILLCLAAFQVSAQEDKTYKKIGNQYFENGKFFNALESFLRYQDYEANDLEVKYKMGVCYYYANQLDQSRRYLNYVLDNEKNAPAEVYFYLARNAHSENDFTEAIRHYKEFLRNIEKTNVNRNFVKDAIRRCAYGLQINYRKSAAIVENLGEKVNSKGDDFKPILSPNFQDKLYFSSARKGSLGGLRDEEGLEDEFAGKYSSDMYATSVQNGEWQATTPMSYLLNSPRHDMVIDFSEDGSRMYYFKGYTQFSGDIFVDTFRTNIEKRSLFSKAFNGPIEAHKGDVDPYFFNDTIVLFASRRSGGYGGLDLYISTFTKGKWTKAENLGPSINSAYDEISPFLALDGRTIYYSSNRSDMSVGGFDIFKAIYIDRTERWSNPQNMNIPINSAGDDMHFRLSKDGKSGFFASSRKESLGKRDIFVAYFKEFLKEQSETSTPLVFNQVNEFKAQIAIEMADSGAKPTDFFDESVIRDYVFEPLFYEKDGEIMTPKNIKILNRIGQVMIDNPTVELVMTSHGDDRDPVDFDLFFSIKRVEKAADYLTANGVNPANIKINALGSAYPLAKNKINGKRNISGEQLNRRVDFQFDKLTGLPLNIVTKSPAVNKTVASPKAKIYKALSKGLSYKVQIAAIKQMYKGNAILRYNGAMIESSGDSDVYKYTVGWYQGFRSAAQLKEDLIANGGITEAFVVPYINGVRISKEEAKQLVGSYPDLSNYLK